MKNLIAGLLILAAMSWAVAQTVQNKTQLYSSVDTSFPDNTTGAITPAIIRSFFDNMIASLQSVPVVNAQTGTTYTFVVTDAGKVVTFNNAGAIAATLPQAIGNFGSGWSTYVKNNGAGAVTITPTTSLINSAASLVVASGSSIFIMSDGTNYQTWGSAGTGTVTSVTCGTGLTGGTITSTGTCALDVPVLMSRGGTGDNLTPANGGMVYTTGTSMAILAPTATARQMLQSGASAAPSWSTATWPSTTVSGYLLFSQGTNIVSPYSLSDYIDASVGGARGAILYKGTGGVWTFLNPGTNGQVLITSGAGTDPLWSTIGGTGTVTSVTCGTGLTGGTFTTTGTCATDIASYAGMRAGAANKILDAQSAYTPEVTVTYSTTTVFDFSTFINASVTLTGNISTVTVSNMKSGQCGNIRFIQDGTGSRVISTTGTSFNASFFLPSGTRPSLTATANAVDNLAYCCPTPAYCIGSFLYNLKSSP